MGFAAVQTECLEHNSAPISALERIQVQLITNQSVSAAEIHAAIKRDIESCAPFNLTILTKALTSRRVPIDSSEIDALAVTIRDAMTKTPLGDYGLFLNYANAAVICIRSKEARSSRR